MDNLGKSILDFVDKSNVSAETVFQKYGFSESTPLKFSQTVFKSLFFLPLKKHLAPFSYLTILTKIADWNPSPDEMK